MGQGYVEPEYKDPGYEAAKQRSMDKTRGIFDASISEAQNKSASAGAVQGVGNAGRLAADTYAKVSEQKNRRLSATEDQYNNYELQHKASFNNQNAFARQQYEMNKPGFLDYLGFAGNLAGSGFGIASALGAFGGAMKTLDKTTTTPAINLGVSGSEVNSLKDIQPFDSFGSQKNNPLSPMWKPDLNLSGNSSINSPFVVDKSISNRPNVDFSLQDMTKGKLKSNKWGFSWK